MIELLSIERSIFDNGIKILVHGPAGSGKTVLATTTNASTIIINAESGLLSLRQVVEDNPSVGDNIKVVTISTIADLLDVYQYLKEEHRCEWVVLDSISEIAEVVLADEKKASSDPRKAYGNTQDQVGDILRAFRDLPKYHVYMAAKQDMKPDQHSGITRRRPSMPGQNLPQSIPYLFDEVFALRVEENEEGDLERMLQTGQDLQYECKDRSGRLERFEKPDLSLILSKIRKGDHKKPEIVHISDAVKKSAPLPTESVKKEGDGMA